ncbi:MarR family transcriptional regulator [Kribbella sandramycini]|uniref:MarR family transcriptional regulator n=1 Tax=Kribbella sandramycini TaxID=60450 RepID=A0A7Y4L023_9ACTN|nr:MarR family transcriptional regulator [Kribbella sandramycini]MBB6569138.1 DNA-binding MarR family transcriptional regulator [Kribbella sandramycini]NOL41021.1 MarR family transcriptional regulator [Kribbella sandramycini]
MADGKGLTDRELRTWRTFLGVATVLNHRIEQQLKDTAGLSHPQYEVLARLSNAPDGELRMTELAGVALTSKSGLSYQITQLEKAGLVQRRPCDNDDRGIIAALTEAGWSKLRETAPAHVNLVRSTFVTPLTPDQFTHLTAALDTLGAHLGITPQTITALREPPPT